MIIEVTNEKLPVNLIPASEIEEIAQNIRMILQTIKGTVPMDREMGLDSALIDMPVSAAQARITANIATAINTYEPRAKVKSVKFGDNNLDGLVNVTVIVEANDTQ